MVRIFLNYTEIGLLISIIILVLSFLLPKINKKYTSGFTYIVWLIIAIRLIIPINFELPYNNTPIHIDINTNLTQRDYNNEIKNEVIDVTLNNNNSISQQYPKSISSISPLFVLFYIWVFGVLFSAIRYFYLKYSLNKFLNKYSRNANIEIQNFYSNISNSNKPPLLYVCEKIESPMIVGIYKPKIYIPNENFDYDELEMIFNHELGHWKRHDLIYKLILFIACSLHWYNPFVWLMQKNANQAIELYCDSKTVEGKSISYKKAYSYIILKNAENSLLVKNTITSCFSEGKENLKMRISEVLNNKKKKHGIPIIVFIIILALSLSSFISCSNKDLYKIKDEYAFDINKTEETINTWISSFMERDGSARYSIMTDNAKKKLMDEQEKTTGDKYNTVIGYSSPWIESYNVVYYGDMAYIDYKLADSTPQYYNMKEVLKLKESDNKILVDDYITSILYNYDTQQQLNPTIIMDDKISESMAVFLLSHFNENMSDMDIESIKFTTVDTTKKELKDRNIEYEENFDIEFVSRNKFPQNGEYTENLFQDYYKPIKTQTNVTVTYIAPYGITDINDEKCISREIYINK